MKRINGRPRGPALMLVGLLVVSVAACGDDDSSDTTSQPTALSVATDVVWGPFNMTDEEKPLKSCVNNSRFPRNSQIVWRTRIIDPVTGEQMGDDVVAVQVRLGDGQIIDLKYGDHPRDTPTDTFWAGSFKVPVDYPTGTLSFEVVATATDGRTGTFLPFNVAPSLLTITDEVLETIPTQ
ncbi:MAG: hypothetical protein HZA58_04875 [Acidimicrobiia bacterium]|nr:hypothetical protein [Acidimicrobiia bacterium]